MPVGWHLEAGPGTCPANPGDALVLRIGLALRDRRRAFHFPNAPGLMRPGRDPWPGLNEPRINPHWSKTWPEGERGS